MATRRFFCEQPIGGASEYALEGSEHQHLTKVIRAKINDEVILFDGSGIECRAAIHGIERNRTNLSILSRDHIDRELAIPLKLAVALPKGDRQQWIVEKAVELGVTELIPLTTEFGVAQPAQKAIQRMGKQIIAASKQCGRNILMRLADPMSVADILVERSTNVRALLAHPGGNALRHCSLPSPEDQLTLLVGPEGGFSPKEIKLAQQNHCEIVSLGTRILRIETAAVALVCRFIYA